MRNENKSGSLTLVFFLRQKKTKKERDFVGVIVNLFCSSVQPFLAVWAGLIGKTPHSLLWFWCDVSLAVTPSWTLWELLGIERLTGVFELGDLIECSCHNISNTVYSPIMTQLGHNGHITKKMTRQEKIEREVSSLWSGLYSFFCHRHFNYGKLFFFPFFQLKYLRLLLGFLPASLKCCTELTCTMNLSWDISLFESPPSGNTGEGFLTRKVVTFAHDSCVQR